MAGAASAHQAATASHEETSQQRAVRTRRTSADPQRAQQGATAAAAAAPAPLDSLSRLQQLADASPQVAQLRRLQALANARFAPVAQLAGGPEEEVLVQGKFATAEPQPQLQQAPRANNNGLPNQLKSGIESLSGLSMDHVRVHYNSAQPAQTSQLSAPVLQATFGKDFKTQLNSLASLNAALALLNPGVAAVTLAGVGVAGASAAMLDQVIAANTDTLYDGIVLADVIAFYSDALATAVDTQAPTFSYDSHGDKHFPGGSAGTKFSDGKGEVNPQLESFIEAQIGRIRRDAAGAKTNYYYTLAGIAQCSGKDLVIQISYNPATDTIEYHGYPDNNVQVRSLSRAKGGQAIS